MAITNWHPKNRADSSINFTNSCCFPGERLFSGSSTKKSNSASASGNLNCSKYNMVFLSFSTNLVSYTLRYIRHFLLLSLFSQTHFSAKMPHFENFLCKCQLNCFLSQRTHVVRIFFYDNRANPATLLVSVLP